MTEEDLIEIEQQLKMLTPYPWNWVVGKTNPLRFDIFSGPTDLKTVQDIALSKDKSYKQVCHYHKFQPNPHGWFEENHNAENDMKFIHRSPEIVEKLIQEIRKLRDYGEQIKS